MGPEIVLQLVAVLGVGFGAYAAIRADLARLHEKAENAAAAAQEAQRRIDRHLDIHHERAGL